MTVPREVAVVRGDFLARVLFGSGEFHHDGTELLTHPFLALCTGTHDPLGLLAGETEFLENRLRGESREPNDLPLLTWRYHLHHRTPLVLNCPRCSEHTTSLAHETSISKAFFANAQNTNKTLVSCVFRNIYMKRNEGVIYHNLAKMSMFFTNFPVKA